MQGSTDDDEGEAPVGSNARRNAKKRSVNHSDSEGDGMDTTKKRKAGELRLGKRRR